MGWHIFTSSHLFSCALKMCVENRQINESKMEIGEGKKLKSPRMDEPKMGEEEREGKYNIVQID